MLRELIRRELSAARLEPIKKEELEAVSTEITETLRWCSSSPRPELCDEYSKIISKSINAISQTRLMKASFTELNEELEESSFLRSIKDLTSIYYFLFFSGLVTHDMKVAVKLKKPLILEGRLRDKGIVTYLDVREALFLAAMNYVELLPLTLTSGLFTS